MELANTGLEASIELLRTIRSRLLRSKKDIIRRLVDLIFNYLSVVDQTKAAECHNLPSPETRSKAAMEIAWRKELRDTAGEVVRWISFSSSSARSAETLRHDVEASSQYSFSTSAIWFYCIGMELHA